MKVLHSSDLHGNYKLLWEHTDFDVWVDTGDFFPNKSRGDRNREVPFQTKWFQWKGLGSRMKEWLAGRPVIYVPGNHDYVSLGALLSRHHVETHLVTPKGFNLLGERWAGFREINWISGEWNGEKHNLTPYVSASMNANPTILVTHAPPQGILDEEEGYGIRPLTPALMYRMHKIRAHLFGHCHQDGGKRAFMRDTHFYNGAGCATVLSI